MYTLLIKVPVSLHLYAVSITFIFQPSRHITSVLLQQATQVMNYMTGVACEALLLRGLGTSVTVSHFFFFMFHYLLIVYNILGTVQLLRGLWTRLCIHV